jgi:hypothetical protein
MRVKNSNRFNNIKNQGSDLNILKKLKYANIYVITNHFICDKKMKIKSFKK